MTRLGQSLRKHTSLNSMQVYMQIKVMLWLFSNSIMYTSRAFGERSRSGLEKMKQNWKQKLNTRIILESIFVTF